MSSNHDRLDGGAIYFTNFDRFYLLPYSHERNINDQKLIKFCIAIKSIVRSGGRSTKEKLTSKSIAAKCPAAEQAGQSYRKIISSWSGSEEDPKSWFQNLSK